VLHVLEEEDFQD
jgi:Retroviral aspartyl protease